MKLLLYLVLVTVAALVASSLDGIADPPAVNPHASNVKIARPRELPSTVGEQSLAFASVCVAVRPPFRRIGLYEIAGPNDSSDEMALVACAADPSPPRSL